jgi:hypothetical protein
MSEPSFVDTFEFVLNDSTPIDAMHPVFTSRNFISGDADFFDRVNVVVNNLKGIKTAQPNISVIVSFVQNAAGENFKITLT